MVAPGYHLCSCSRNVLEELDFIVQGSLRIEDTNIREDVDVFLDFFQGEFPIGRRVVHFAEELLDFFADVKTISRIIGILNERCESTREQNDGRSNQ